MPEQLMPNFEKIIGREYWTTSKGQRLFPHEFEDEHLANTLGFIHRQARVQRLHQALCLCNLIHRMGYDGYDTEGYYRAYKREVDLFLEPEINDKQWLKQNSKIYVLLMEEAKYRGVEPNDTPPKKTIIQKIKARYNYMPNYQRTLRNN
jgi:hypothetical protein